MPKRKETIELVINGMPISYTSEGRLITFICSRGCVYQISVPEKWATTRIVQHMTSIVEGNYKW